MKKTILSLCALFMCSISLIAQDENDAIRYGYTNYFGTARGMGIGNALGSVGGDFSTLSVNPAGIGVYRKSEFSFSPSFNVNENGSTYNNSETNSRDSKFNFGQFGLVLTKTEKPYQKWKHWKTASLAFGMNRSASFSNLIEYSGTNNKNSIVNKWVADFNSMGGLNSTTLSTINYPAYAAYQTYLIDRDPNDTTKAKSYVPLEGEGLKQTKTIRQTGGMQEYVISGGGNYMEKLLVGATLGIVNIKYNRDADYREEDISGNDSNQFKYLKFSEVLRTEGTGYNLKLGVIYKFNKIFRAGFAFHTPTHIEFADQSLVSMESHTENLLSQSPITRFAQDTAQAFNYAMNTPYKAIFSATLLFKQYGFITADWEYVDYASMKYNFGVGYESLSNDMNNAIQNRYRAVNNLRLGLEIKLKDLYLRTGAAYYASPYKDLNWNADRTQLSIGSGYRGKAWFLDFAFIHTSAHSFENPYVLSTATPRATIQTTTSNVMFTLGWKF